MEQQNFSFDPVDALKDSAVKFKKTLEVIPHVKFEELKGKMGFHHTSNLYGTRKAGRLIIKGKMGPYNSDAASLAAAGIVIEQITTYHGKNYIKIHIADLEETIIGEGIVTFEDWKKSELGKKFLSEQLLANLEDVVDHVWIAVRKADGKETKDLFDGIDTQLVAARVKAADADYAKLSTEAGNLSAMSAALTSVNAKDVLTAEWKKLPRLLRRQKLDLHISEEAHWAYCDSYALDRGDQHNEEYEQEFLFGTKKKVRFVVQDQREAASPLIWTVKGNLSYGTGARGIKENLKVKEDNNMAFLQMNHEMYFGVAVGCYHKDFFHVSDQAGEPTYEGQEEQAA